LNHLPPDITSGQGLKKTFLIFFTMTINKKLGEWQENGFADARFEAQRPERLAVP
jgi:hypothetical protein